MVIFCRVLIIYRRNMYYKHFLNPFMPTVPTFAVRETDVSRHNGGTSGAPIKPLRDGSALRALCRETLVSRTTNVAKAQWWA